MRIQIFRLLTVLCLQLPFTFAQEAAATKAADPDPLVTAESDYILKDFHFVNGESLPELKLHYRTIGQPTSNPSSGEVKNAVLLIHGTTGTGKEFLSKGFRDAMFEPPDNRWTRPSTTSSYPMLSDLAVRVSPVMGCMIASRAMATKIWSQPRNDWSPRVSASNILG